MYINVNGKKEKVKTLTLAVSKYKQDLNGNSYHKTDLYLNNYLLHTTKVCYCGNSSAFRMELLDDLKDSNIKLYEKLNKIMALKNDSTIIYSSFHDCGINCLELVINKTTEPK